MAMDSLSLLGRLDHIPLERAHQRYDIQDVVALSNDIQASIFALEITLGVDSACIGIFDLRHVPDDVREAFQKAFSNVAQNESLYHHYTDIVGRGTRSVAGFISCLKGKLAEIRLVNQLNNAFPDGRWSLAPTANQPGWDIMGHGANGVDIPIQVKMGGESYVGPVLDKMKDDPHTLFATSTEIHSSVATNHPELMHQIGDMGISNFHFQGEVTHDLALVAANHGIDVPDSVGDILPYAREIVLGIVLIKDIISVERDFKHVHLDQRGRIHALKALALFSRFSVSFVCTTLGAYAGGHIDMGSGFTTLGIPTALGALSGAGFAWWLNNALKSHILEIGMGLFDMTEDDMFYLRNKICIDQLAHSYVENGKKVISRLSVA